MFSFLNKIKHAIIIFIIIILLFAVLIFSIYGQRCQKNGQCPETKNGFLDLSEWDMKKEGLIDLKGDWEFYWEKLYSPDDFENKNIQAKSFSNAASKWKNSRTSNILGYATYRIKIKIKNKNEILGLKIPLLFTSSKIWIDNQCIEYGKVGTNRKESKPYIKPDMIFFKPGNDYIDIIVQVSNFHYHTGGPSPYFTIGTSEQIKQHYLNIIMLDIFIFGAILIIALYHLALFVLNLKDKTTLFFSIFCLLILVKLSIFDRRNIVLFFHTLNYALLLRIGTCLMFYIAPLFLLFTYKQYQKEFSRLFITIFSAAEVLTSFIILATPASTLHLIISNVNFIYILAATIYIITCMVFAIKNKRDGAILYLLGFLFYTFTVANDILFYREIINTGYLMPIGVIVFILIYAFIISNKNAKVYYKSEKLSSELQQYSNKLEDKVKDRTYKLEDANRQKTEAFINISHELKTPATLISHYLESHISKLGASDDLVIAKKSTDKLINDIKNILDFEKMEKNMQLYDHSKIINLTKMLEESLIIFKNISAEKEIQFNRDIEKNVFTKIDEFALERIINNLLDNAIKYTDSNGQISVILKTKVNKIFLKIKDSGKGMAESELEYIFKPYHQISHKKQNIQGIGMGLSIVKKIIDEIDGEIYVESKLNTGSEFQIVLVKYIPADTDEIVNIVNKEVPISQPYISDVSDTEYNDNKPVLLIVEDNLQLLNFLKEALNSEYNIFCANNGEQALSKLKSIPIPNLIISDIMMDVMDGFTFIKKLYKEKEYKIIPFIFLTARTSDIDKLKGLKSGAVDFISKPFKLKELKEKIKSQINIVETQKTAAFDDMKRKIHLALINDNIEANYDKMKNYNFTAREHEIAKQLLQGKETKEIAYELFISISTVKNHISSIYKKCGVQNRVELIKKLSGKIKIN